MLEIQQKMDQINLCTLLWGLATDRERQTIYVLGGNSVLRERINPGKGLESILGGQRRLL